MEHWGIPQLGYMTVTYIVVGVENPGNVLCKVAVKDSFDIVTMVDWGENPPEWESSCWHYASFYSGTSLKGLSELRAQYKKPPY